MKKLFLLLAFVTFSCSNDETIPASSSPNQNTSKNGYNPGGIRTDPTKLARVIFYPGTTFQKKWFFYPNGLLKRIEDSTGNTVRNFEYDSNNNLLAVTGYNPQTFTYDSNNRLTAINGNLIEYDAFENRYIQSLENSYPHRLEFQLNGNSIPLGCDAFYFTEEPSIVEFSDLAFVPSYANDNLVSYMVGEYPTFYQYDSNTNPLKMATLPACKVMPLTFAVWSTNIPFIDGNYCSANNITHLSYDGLDPESASFSYDFNSNGLPTKQTETGYYFGQFDYTRVSILYYYQGDVIPNP